MSFIDAIRHRLRSVLRPRDSERERDEEIAFHHALAEQQRERQGADARTARFDAAREFGNATYFKEEARHMGALRWIDTVAQDLRFGARTLRRSPVFTLVALLSLALGIGANTAIFGVTYALLLQRLPVAHPEQLFQVRRVDDRGNASEVFSDAEYRALQGIPGVSLAALTGAGARPVEVAGVELQQLGDMYAMDGAVFPLLGIPPAAGRYLTRADDERLSTVAVVSEDLADNAFGSATAAVGRTIALRHANFTIVGVTPRQYRGFSTPGSFSIATPLRTATQLLMPPERLARGVQLTVLARVTAVDPRGARAAIGLAFERCCARGELAQVAVGRGSARQQHAILIDISRGIPNAKFDPRERYGRTLFALMAGVAVLLLIACANVGNLLLARAASRTRELAVRLSLGASRRRLVRQLLIESVQLGAGGAALGLLFAVWGTTAIAKHLPPSLGPIDKVVALRPNPVLFAFTVVVAIACTIIFGVLPAIRATRVDPVAGLREGRHRTGQPTSTLDRWIVGVQVALALMLVCSAALLVETFRNLRHTDAGFDPTRLVLSDVDTRATPYAPTGIRPVYGEMLRRLRQLPGVHAVGMATRLPLVYGGGSPDDIFVPGYQPSANEDMSVDYITATPGYLAALGIPVRRGRDLVMEDNAAAPHVAVISERIAEKFFAGRDPIGAVVRRNDASGDLLRIVGVARDAKYYDLRAPALATVYVPFEQSRDWGFLGVAVRTVSDPTPHIQPVRSALSAAAPGISIRWVQTMQTAVDNHLAREQAFASLATVFGVLALALAAVGLYGVMAYQVAARTGEIGVRMALGANAQRVVWMVLRQSLFVIGGGIVVGVPLALSGGHALVGQLYGVTPWHPATLAGAVAVLLGVGVLASLIPARRAARVDPLIAMRTH